ncbi:hypothetical protein OAF63_07030 [Saprospiraceae bacterium]|nr:hypothetical protein [Saprospiraceae bacterium]
MLTFKYETLYQSADDPNRKFLVDRVRFYISNFNFIDQNGIAAGSNDSIQFQSDLKSFYVEDNFALVDRDIFSGSTIKNFIAPGVYDKIEFSIGLESEIRAVDPSSVPTTHALSIADDSLMYETTEYLSSLVIFRPDDARGTDSTIIMIKEPTYFSKDLINPVEFIEGLNVTVQIQIDYNIWFENINIFTDSKAEIESQMVENLPNAFEIVDIILE